MRATVIILQLTLGAFAAIAQTLTCTFQFNASGTVGPQDFSSADITITTTGFTGTIGAGYIADGATLYNTASSITISGVGTFQFWAPTAISAFTLPSGTSVYQYIYFEVTGVMPLTPVIYASSVSPTTDPWGMLSSVGPISFPAEIEGCCGLASNGQTLNLYDAFTPVTFQATLSPGVPCAGSSVGNVADVQAVINESLGVTPPDADLNGDGVVNVVEVQIVSNDALGCGVTTSSTPMRYRTRKW
jgi:hypothetical protein